MAETPSTIEVEAKILPFKSGIEALVERIRLGEVISLVEMEAQRRREDLGNEDHSDVSSYSLTQFADPPQQAAAQKARGWQQWNLDREKADDLAWDGLLLQQVYAVLASTGDQTELGDELIQLAALVVSWAVQVKGRPDPDDLPAASSAVRPWLHDLVDGDLSRVTVA